MVDHVRRLIVIFYSYYLHFITLELDLHLERKQGRKDWRVGVGAGGWSCEDAEKISLLEIKNIEERFCLVYFPFLLDETGTGQVGYVELSDS
jgi:hypothetical protein